MSKILLLMVVAVFIMFGADAVRAQNNPAQVQDKKLKIIKKPAPHTDGRCDENEGLTSVRATFDKSGKVTAVEIVVASACDYFNRNALQKAREIKFEAQVENGEPVTVTKVVVYKFTKQ